MRRWVWKIAAAGLLLPAFAALAIWVQNESARDLEDWPTSVFFVVLGELLPVLFFLWFIGICIRTFIHELPSQRRKRRSRYCSVCHYDLKSNASGVCPECGTRFRPEIIEVRP